MSYNVEKSLLDKVDGPNRHMLLKTAFLLKDSKSYLEKAAKKKKKKKATANDTSNTHFPVISTGAEADYFLDAFENEESLLPAAWTASSAQTGHRGTVVVDVDQSRPGTSSSKSGTNSSSRPNTSLTGTRPSTGGILTRTSSSASFGSFADLKLPILVEESARTHSHQREDSVQYDLTFLPAEDTETGTGMGHHVDTSHLPQSWRNKRVNNIFSEEGKVKWEHIQDEEKLKEERLRAEADANVLSKETGTAHTRSAWENELARHILSVYATTRVAAEDMTTSNVIMDYVDADKKVPVETVKKELFFSKTKSEQQTREREREQEIADLIRRLEASDKDAADSAKFRTNITVKTKDGRTVIIRGTPRVFPIWYTSTGAVYSDWSMLSGGERLQAHLKDIYEKGNYMEYLEIVKKLLDEEWAGINDVEGKLASTSSPKRNRGTTTEVSPPKSPNRAGKDDTFGFKSQTQNNSFIETVKPPMTLSELIVLWRQFILTTNAMAGLAIQNKKTDLSQRILRLGTAFVSREDILPGNLRRELNAYMNESNAYFFFRTKNYGAAISLVIKAMQEFESRGMDFAKHLAAAKLHLACIETQLGKNKESHQLICEVIGMVEEGTLSFQEASPEQLCIASVAYHNLAVSQLKLRAPDLACRSSVNARKIARLCLSFSNRWIDAYQYTHDACIEDMKYEFKMKLKEGLIDERQLESIKDLIDAMFDPTPL